MERAMERTMENFSPSSERNKDAITEQLIQTFADCTQVIEIGSGSGQHIMHFAQQLPDIHWQPTDLADFFPGLEQNLSVRAANIAAPQQLDLSSVPWLPGKLFDGLFSANTLHIMSWQHVIGFFERAGKQLSQGGRLCVYGPFNYNGEFTSEGNVKLEGWLKGRDPLSGIRDFEAVNQLASDNGFELLDDHTMPANNRLLVWNKVL